ncbi:NIPSNAP family protein [Cytophagaceae bacterium YF14B1]|uniref:NIPSNAP family protein n=1 Tax=Xanthocytophaga flava TaxID=3048013 RepID=A0AAE3U6R5_9BACT|nr:NIPSNAP family protein [Xanthocytophaga flavus]MDJ1481591.1 NIPSNAP family protein [Xanthocytophaga flavus]
MKILLLSCLGFYALAMSTFFPSEENKSVAKADRCYEMRIYYAEPGKLEDLLARFRNHTTKIFEKHGMTNEGYWLPIDNKDNKLVYVLSYPSREARNNSWKSFGSDPEWKKVASESEKNGNLVAKVESFFMKTTDFSPKKITKKGSANRVFELRTYKATSGNLPALLSRFRDHTTKLFEKHGMTNLWYWTYTDKEQGADDMLVYILAHSSQEAGLKSFEKFRDDPQWQKVRKESEDKAGGSLTVSVESLYMVPTDFSPVK